MLGRGGAEAGAGAAGAGAGAGAGSALAAAGLAAGAPAPSDSVPSSAPTSTVSPSAATISARVPAWRRVDFQSDLVGLQLQQRLVQRDRVARLLQPFRDRRFGDRLAQRGDLDFRWP